jgi:hypothetical protein
LHFFKENEQIMIENLVTLLGKSIESEEIKGLLESWRVLYPSKITCTADSPGLKGKIEKDCVRLYFGRGGNSRYMKPIPAKFKGGFIAMFTMIEFTKKRKGGIPFDVEHSMTPAELTAILGEPKVVEFMGTTTTWRKNYTEQHEFVVSDTLATDGTSIRSMTLTFHYEPDLYTMEDYEKAGL